MSNGRYTENELNALVEDFKRDGFCVLRAHFSKDKIREWREAFMPLLNVHIEREGHKQNRGSMRYYVTLPFEAPFADTSVYEDADILHVCENIVGRDMVMCQLASDTPLKGSDYQEIHSDAMPLFPETNFETPTFQLAVNFPLVDVTEANGPFEVARATHLLPKAEGLKLIETGAAKLESIMLAAGDVMIRDVRGLHRGTPNKTDEPRPMCVIGYSRRWLYRPEVNIRIPRAMYETLSERGRQLLRFNPVVASLDEVENEEVYQAFAF
ncbi:MAG: phytanoyl-CoA dioxygenase family protein [Pyrinomonadaceae bacterium MAG19_C2-C3]|nr:phytanoyl-CoA dioxygenase family protein [Pyrinomonadaceae bacterium MAG19_C2-C3]